MAPREKTKAPPVKTRSTSQSGKSKLDQLKHELSVYKGIVDSLCSVFQVPDPFKLVPMLTELASKVER